MATPRTTQSKSANSAGANQRTKTKERANMAEATPTLDKVTATVPAEPVETATPVTEGANEIPVAAAAEDLFAQLTEEAKKLAAETMADAKKMASEKMAGAKKKVKEWMNRRFAKAIDKVRKAKDRFVDFLKTHRRAITIVTVVAASVAVAFLLEPVFTVVLSGLLMASLIMQVLRPNMQSSSVSV